MDSALISALVAGVFSLIGVVTVVIVNMRLSHRTIISTEAIALRSVIARTDGDLRGEIAMMNLKLDRCEAERAADAEQRHADSVRHMADEEQRRVDDERHRIDEARHEIDLAEIVATRKHLSLVQSDLDELRKNLRLWANAAQVEAAVGTAVEKIVVAVEEKKKDP